MNVSELAHYGTIALTVGITSVGVGIGEGLASYAALQAIHIQPSARADITKAAIMGMALIETAAIMATFVAIMLIMPHIIALHYAPQPLYAGIATLGIALAICVPGFVLGIVSSLPTSAACYAIARQPFTSQTIVRFMLMTQSLIQTPIIFGLIIAIFIKDQAATAHTLNDSIRLISSGLCIGIGSVGPAIGLGIYAQAACLSLGVNRAAYNKLLSFTLISQAIIETPIIFALVISALLLLVVPAHITDAPIQGVTVLAAGLCTGLGTIGTGIASGRTAAAACEQITANPAQHATISRISMFAQGLIETCAIYPVLISFLLIFFV